MNIKQIATALSLSMILGGSLPALARTSHKAAEEAGKSTTTTAESGSKTKKHEHKNSAREKKEKAETATPETEKKASTAEKKPSTAEKKGGYSLFRLFAPQQTNNTEESKTEPSKKLEERKLSGAAASHSGMVYVHGYTTKSGKHVEGYWRHKPGQG